MGCCFQDLFSMASSILVQFSSSLFSMHSVSVHYWIDQSSLLLSIPVRVFASWILTPVSLDEVQLPRYLNFSTNFRGLPRRVRVTPRWKHMYTVLITFRYMLMPPAACSRLRSRDSAWVSVFTRSAMSSA